MNTNTIISRTATTAALIGSLFAAVHANAAETMSIDAGVPLQATLLPTVSVTADASNPDGPATWSIAATAPSRVTLMPPVRVTAQSSGLAVTMLPTVRVVAQAEKVVVEKTPALVMTNASSTQLPLAEDSHLASRSRDLSLQVMPR